MVTLQAVARQVRQKSNESSEDYAVRLNREYHVEVAANLRRLTTTTRANATDCPEELLEALDQVAQFVTDCPDT